MLVKRINVFTFGGPDKLTFERWKRGNASTLTDDVLKRISYVFGVYKNLRILFPKIAQANEWLLDK